MTIKLNTDSLTECSPLQDVRDALGGVSAVTARKWRKAKGWRTHRELAKLAKERAVREQRDASRWARPGETAVLLGLSYRTVCRYWNTDEERAAWAAWRKLRGARLDVNRLNDEEKRLIAKFHAEDLHAERAAWAMFGPARG